MDSHSKIGTEADCLKKRGLRKVIAKDFDLGFAERIDFAETAG